MLQLGPARGGDGRRKVVVQLVEQLLLLGVGDRVVVRQLRRLLRGIACVLEMHRFNVDDVRVKSTCAPLRAAAAALGRAPSTRRASRAKSLSSLFMQYGQFTAHVAARRALELVRRYYAAHGLRLLRHDDAAELWEVRGRPPAPAARRPPAAAS